MSFVNLEVELDLFKKKQLVLVLAMPVVCFRLGDPVNQGKLRIPDKSWKNRSRNL